MACFSLAWIQQLLIWFVEVFAVLALLRLLVAFVVGAPLWPLVTWPGTPPVAGTAPIAGFGAFLVAALNIIIWAFLMIALISFVFGLISCLVGAGGFSFMPPHR